MSSYPESDPLPPYEKVPKAPTPQPQPQPHPPPTPHPGPGTPRANPYGNAYQMYPYSNSMQNPRAICDTMGHQQATQFGLAGEDSRISGF
ncbi:hypothetical protein NLI96_g5757 [Meripilus lineatus]|uniref:Uncharacterized protein n=1 Tax=Meripilus lineatus TaxID=2056292 RepID=A0AAD5V7R4_9APHY|nr:hypothetical protein NLI96_g5757 [Physisporinus lineatus]